MALLPILLGAGLLFLVAKGGGSSAPAVPTKTPFEQGYSAGYVDAIGGKAKTADPAKLPAAAASGNAAEFAKGYADGYAKGIKSKPSSGPSCLASGLPHSLLDYQRALIAGKYMSAYSDKGRPNADGICGDITIAAIKSFQKSQGLSVTGMIDKKTSDELSLLIPTGSDTEDKVWKIARPSDWDVYGLGSAFIIPAPSQGSYDVALTASPAAGGHYVVESIISNPAGSKIAPGDLADLYTYDKDANEWIYTTPPV